MMTVPKRIPKTYADFLVLNLLVNNDWAKTAGIYPTMNPPVGPVSTAAPDLKPEKTGRPASPNNIYRIIAIVALTGPNMAPIK